MVSHCPHSNTSVTNKLHYLLAEVDAAVDAEVDVDAEGSCDEFSVEQERL